MRFPRPISKPRRRGGRAALNGRLGTASRRAFRFGLASGCGPLAALLVALAGCAHFDRISEEGGLVGRLLARDEPVAIASAAREAAASSSAAVDPGVAVPYGPEDFEHHAGDAQFAWHWSTVRVGERIEVKGLVENRRGPAVQGVTLRLAGADGSLDVEAPGLIRPGQLRPFYFTARYGGDERQTRLSIAAVDRNVVAGPTAPGAGVRTPATPINRPEGAPGAEAFTDHGRDHFFSLHWSSRERGGEIEVNGIIENWNGPVVRDVTLLINAYGKGGASLATQRLRLGGPFDKKAVRPFSVRFAPSDQPERVAVEVGSYDFYRPRDK